MTQPPPLKHMKRGGIDYSKKATMFTMKSGIALIERRTKTIFCF
jgi:tRNA(Leu) C34 or U34 (ribose-2'-O)-methylase TrmL